MSDPVSHNVRSAYRLRSRRPLHGFTLIELLVVISIVAIMIAILLPALEKARDAATTLVCQSRVRSLGQAFHMYAHDHKGALPRHAPSNPANDPDNEGWDMTLVPYVNGGTFGKGHGGHPPPFSLMPHVHARDSSGEQFSAKVEEERLRFYCPSWRYPMPTDRWGNKPGTPGSTRVSSWASFRVGSLRMNEWLSAAGEWSGDFDDTNARIDQHSPTEFILSEGHNHSRFTNQQQIYFHPAHGDRAPFLFFDGRVELNSADEIPFRGSTPGGQDFWGEGSF